MRACISTVRPAMEYRKSLGNDYILRDSVVSKATASVLRCRYLRENLEYQNQYVKFPLSVSIVFYVHMNMYMYIHTYVDL